MFRVHDEILVLYTPEYEYMPYVVYGVFPQGERTKLMSQRFIQGKRTAGSHILWEGEDYIKKGIDRIYKSLYF